MSKEPGEPSIVLRQDLTEAVFLTVFASRTEKLADIALGNDLKAARIKAERLIAAVQVVNGFTDKT